MERISIPTPVHLVYLQNYNYISRPVLGDVKLLKNNKMKSKYALFFILISITSLVSAQENQSYLDTIKISIDNRFKIVIATYDVKALIKSGSVQEDIALFQSNMTQIKNEIPEYRNYKIDYVPGESQAIKEGENKKSFIVKENSVELSNLNNEVFIQGQNYKMHVLFDNLTHLFEYDLRSEFDAVFNEMPEKIKFANTFNYSVHNNEVTYLKEIDRKNGALDVFETTIGVGAGIIKSRPMNDFTYTIGVILSRKGILHHNIFTSFRTYITFDDRNYISYNNFVNVGYRINLSKNIDKPDWIGMELGYNINNSELFGNNTFVISTIKDFGRFNIAAQIYISKLYSESSEGNVDYRYNYYPGIKIGFVF